MPHHQQQQQQRLSPSQPSLGTSAWQTVDDDPLGQEVDFQSSSRLPNASTSGLMFSVNQTFTKLLQQQSNNNNTTRTAPYRSPSPPLVAMASQSVFTSSTSTQARSGVTKAPLEYSEKRSASGGDTTPHTQCSDDGQICSPVSVGPTYSFNRIVHATRPKSSGRMQQAREDDLFSAGLQFLATAEQPGDMGSTGDVFGEDDDEGTPGPRNGNMGRSRPSLCSDVTPPLDSSRNQAKRTTTTTTTQSSKQFTTTASGTQRGRRPSNNNKWTDRGSHRSSETNTTTELQSMVSLHSTNHLLNQSRRTSVNTEAHRRLVKERRDQLNMSFKKNRESTLQSTHERMESAHERRAVITNQMNLQRHWAWAALVSISLVTNIMLQGAKTVIKEKRMRAFLLPKTHVVARRWLRMTRLRLLRHSAMKPTIAELRNDRTLGLFSDAHLSHLVDHLELKYYYTNESIIFMGCEDDECFVLCSGTVDVVVGHTTVSTLAKPGIVFGSVGMISGEPRTASIIARVPTLVWVCTRAKFEAFGMADHRVQDALTILSDLRQKNLHAVYKRYINVSYLGTFGPFHDLASSSVDALILGAGPMVCKAGTRLFAREPAPRFFFVLRGSIRIILAATTITAEKEVAGSKGHSSVGAANNSSSKANRVFSVMTPAEAKVAGTPSLREYVQRLVQFPLRGARVTFAEEAPTAKVGDATSTSVHPALQVLDDPTFIKSLSDGSVIVTLKGPLLLNLEPLVINDSIPLIAEAATGCDMLFFTRAQFMAMDPIEIDNMRRSCLDIHREFIPTLPQRGLRTAICRGVLSAAAHPYLKGLDIKQPLVKPPRQRATVIAQGEPLYFDPEHGMFAYIILKGQLQGVTPAANNEPYIWPDLHLVYYGSVNAKAMATTPMDVIRVGRKDIIDWFVAQLITKDMEEYVRSLSTAFETALHRKPHFSFDGIEAGSLEGEGPAARTVMRRRKSMLALHRTANFTVTTEVVEQSKASQNRSMNAALVYQEATMGVKSRKRSTVTTKQQCGDDDAPTTPTSPTSKYAAHDGGDESNDAGSPTASSPRGGGSSANLFQRERRATLAIPSDFRDYSMPTTFDDLSSADDDDDEVDDVNSPHSTSTRQQPTSPSHVTRIMTPPSMIFMSTGAPSVAPTAVPALVSPLSPQPPGRDRSNSPHRTRGGTCSFGSSQAVGIGLRSLDEFELEPEGVDRSFVGGGASHVGGLGASSMHHRPSQSFLGPSVFASRPQISASASVLASSLVLGGSTLVHHHAHIVVNRKTNPLVPVSPQARRPSATFDHSTRNGASTTMDASPHLASIGGQHTSSESGIIPLPRSPQTPAQPPSSVSPRTATFESSPQHFTIRTSGSNRSPAAPPQSSSSTRPARMLLPSPARQITTTTSPGSPRLGATLPTTGTKSAFRPTTADPTNTTNKGTNKKNRPSPLSASAGGNLGDLLNSIRDSKALTVGPRSPQHSQNHSELDALVFGHPTTSNNNNSSTTAKKGDTAETPQAKEIHRPTQHPRPSNLDKRSRGTRSAGGPHSPLKK